MADQTTGQIERCDEAFRAVSRYLRASDVDWTTLSLTMAQLRAVFLLHREGPLTVGGLAQRIGVTPPSVTGTIDRLVAQGLVERRADPSDRRLVINELTEPGQSLVERLQQGRRARFREALRRLDPADLAALERGLLAVVRAAAEASDNADRAPAEQELTGARPG